MIRLMTAMWRWFVREFSPDPYWDGWRSARASDRWERTLAQYGARYEQGRADYWSDPSAVRRTK